MEHVAKDARDETATGESLAGARVFIPISLGNHYYSSEVLSARLSHFIAESQCSVIFYVTACDTCRTAFEARRTKQES